MSNENENEFVQSQAIRESIDEMMSDLGGGETQAPSGEAKPPPSGEVKISDSETKAPSIGEAQVPTPDQATPPVAVEPATARVTALYGQMSQLENELRKLQAENKTLKSGSSFEDLKTKAAQDKFGVLKQLGIDIDSMFEEWIASSPGGGNVHEPKAQASNEISEVKQQLAELQERVKEIRELEERKRHDNKVGEYIRDVEKTVVGGGDRWICVREKLGKGSAQAAMNLAVKVYEQTSVVPDMQDVLDQLEDYYYNEIKDSADLLTKKTGVKAAVTPPEVKQAVKQPTTIMDSGGSTETDDNLTPEQLIAKLALELES